MIIYNFQCKTKESRDQLKELIHSSKKYGETVEECLVRILKEEK